MLMGLPLTAGRGGGVIQRCFVRYGIALNPKAPGTLKIALTTLNPKAPGTLKLVLRYSPSGILMHPVE